MCRVTKLYAIILGINIDTFYENVILLTIFYKTCFKTVLLALTRDATPIKNRGCCKSFYFIYMQRRVILLYLLLHVNLFEVNIAIKKKLWCYNISA